MASCRGDDYDGIVTVVPARVRAGVIVLLLLAGSATASAHHWFNASYDPDRSFTFTGVVTQFEWKNPHVVFHMDVADERTGRATSWLMEMGSPNTLVKSGWSKSALRAGDRVTVEGTPQRNGSPMGYPFVVTLLTTGQRLVASEPVAPSQSSQSTSPR